MVRIPQALRGGSQRVSLRQKGRPTSGVRRERLRRRFRGRPRKLTDCLSKLPALQQLSLYAYNSPLQFQLQELCEEIGKRGVKVVNW